MLVGPVLAAARIGMANPDCRQLQNVGEDRVGQRNSEIWQNAGRFVECALHRGGDELDRWVFKIGAAGWEGCVGYRTDLDALQARGVEFFPNGGFDTVCVNANRVSEL